MDKTVQVYLVDGHRGMGKSTIVNRLKKEFGDQAMIHIIETGVFYTHCKDSKEIMDPYFRYQVKKDTEKVIEYKLRCIAASKNKNNKAVIFVLGRDTALCMIKVIRGKLFITTRRILIKSTFAKYKAMNITNPKFSNYLDTWNDDESLFKENKVLYNHSFKIKKITDNEKVYNYFVTKLQELGVYRKDE